MSYAIGDAYRLGLVAALLPGIGADAPSSDDLERVKYYLSEKLTQLRHTGRVVRSLEDNPYRQSTAAVGRAMRDQWAALDGAETRS
jgi:malonate decarboxylase gamma subunit